MNKALGPCPTWVPGQLYIGGIGLAKGYLHDELKTKASFNRGFPRAASVYTALEIWGDFCPMVTSSFFGREDFQVKVQGLSD